MPTTSRVIHTVAWAFSLLREMGTILVIESKIVFMCFSAGSSFGASVLLGVASVATFRKGEIPNQIPFASIPFLFAFQQVAEGMLWIGLSGQGHESWQRFPVFI